MADVGASAAIDLTGDVIGGLALRRVLTEKQMETLLGIPRVLNTTAKTEDHKERQRILARWRVSLP
jgi:hypothetical protein